MTVGFALEKHVLNMDREVVKRPFARPNQYMLAAAAPHGESSARKAFKGIVAGTYV